MSRRILIVDDEPSIRKVLSAHLRRFGHDVDVAVDGAAAITRLQDETFDLVVSDLKMPQVDGMALLRWVSTHLPTLPVILITAHGTVDSAVEAIKQGAFDYVTKPFDQDELHDAIAKALKTRARRSARAGGAAGRTWIVGSTPEMQDVFHLIEKVAPSPTTVLITGESGTGKELVSRSIHEQSDRPDGPFIQINCGAIPENLFEAELFGYEKGSFTGAVTSKPGRFELASGGTLFLDEVGELPRDMQVKLLRALQGGQVDRVGGLAPIDVDVRIVAATNIDLEEAVAAGAFRGDLYYRLSVFPIRLPPLRDRAGDIEELVAHFLVRFNARLSKDVRQITPEALEALTLAPWPGNIRELENLMERSVLLADGDVIGIEDLHGLRGGVPPVPGVGSVPSEELDDLGLKEYVRVHTVRLERARIQRVLEAEDGNVTRAARRLGISRKSLQTKMKEYGLRDA